MAVEIETGSNQDSVFPPKLITARAVVMLVPKKNKPKPIYVTSRKEARPAPNASLPSFTFRFESGLNFQVAIKQESRASGA